MSRINPSHFHVLYLTEYLKNKKIKNNNLTDVASKEPSSKINLTRMSPATNCKILTTPLTWGDERGVSDTTGQNVAQQAEQVVDDLGHAWHIWGRIPVRQNCPQQLQGQDLNVNRCRSHNQTFLVIFFLQAAKLKGSFQFLPLIMLKNTNNLMLFLHSNLSGHAV